MRYVFYPTFFFLFLNAVSFGQSNKVGTTIESRSGNKYSSKNTAIDYTKELNTDFKLSVSLINKERSFSEGPTITDQDITLRAYYKATKNILISVGFLKGTDNIFSAISGQDVGLSYAYTKSVLGLDLSQRKYQNSNSLSISPYLEYYFPENVITVFQFQHVSNSANRTSNAFRMEYRKNIKRAQYKLRYILGSEFLDEYERANFSATIIGLKYRLTNSYSMEIEVESKTSSFQSEKALRGRFEWSF